MGAPPFRAAIRSAGYGGFSPGDESRPTGGEDVLRHRHIVVKGGFSFRAKKELGLAGEIWQVGYNEHRVKDAGDYREHARYIHENPVRARLCESPREFEYSSASGKYEIDAAPDHLRG